MKEMGESGPTVAVDRVTDSGSVGCQPRRYAGEGHWQPPLPGVTRCSSHTYPEADDHQARVKDARTGDREQVVGG